jgi:hypothetical protein
MALHTDFEFRWKNYRAFEDTGWVKIRPLTILIGPNNSGKTSVTGPMLLLDQTMSSRDSMTPLLTRGPLIDAGAFTNIVHNHNPNKAMFLGLRYHLHDKDAETARVKGKIGKIGTYPPGGLEISLTAGQRFEEIVMQRFALFDVINRPFLRQDRAPDGSYALTSDAFKLRRTELRAIHDSKPLNFLFSPSVALRILQSQRKKKGEKVSVVPPSHGFVMYLNALSTAFGELGDLFRELAYIGPLRERPRRYYSISGEMPISVGSRGEHMANLVRRRLPELREQLNSWIARFEFGSGLTVDNLSDEFFSLAFVGDRSRQTNIAEAGFGARKFCR